MKGIRLLRVRLGTSDCTGNLLFIETRLKTKQVLTRIFATLIEQEFVTDFCVLKSKSIFGKLIALRILVGLARAIRRQIDNTGLAGCNRRPLEKTTAF